MTEHFTREEAAPKFEREDRYIVIKRKDLEKLPLHLRAKLNDWFNSAGCDMPPRQYVVVESDWPEYETVFKMIEARVTGKPFTHALPAQPAEPVNAELVKALEKLIEQYDELAEEDNSGWILASELAKANHAREVLSRAQAAPAVGVPDATVTQEDAELLARVIEQFEDDGETDVDYKTLMRFAALGLLECTRFEATSKGNEIAANTDAPLFASAQPQQKEGV